jgi:hypothetical protein
MKHIFFTLAIIILFCSQLIAQDSISVSDFRYPETKATDLKANVSGGINNQNTGYQYHYVALYNPEYTVLNENHTKNLNLSTTFLYFHSMEDLDNTFTFSADYSPTWNDQYREVQYDLKLSSARELHEATQDFSPTAGWEYAKYFSNSDFHFLGKSQLSYYWYHSHTDNTDDLYPSNNEEYSTTYNSLDVSSYWGIGYGRVREGSFVIEAMRIIDKLKEDGVITNPLTHDQWLSLIDRVAHRREYTTNFERYGKYLGKDILAELESSGVISKEAMTFYSAIKMTEAFDRPLQARFFGWRVYYILGPKDREDIYDYDYAYPNYPYYYYSSHTHEFAKKFSLMNSIGGEFGYPLSLYTHLYSSASVELPTVDAATKLNAYGNISLSYELGEKVSLVGSYNYSDEKLPSMQSLHADDYERIITHQFRGNVIIYLEDFVNLTASMNYTTEQINLYYVPAGPYYLHQGMNLSAMSFQFGVRFNII